MLLLVVSQKPWHEFCSNPLHVTFDERHWHVPYDSPTILQISWILAYGHCGWITPCTFATFSSAVLTEGHNFLHFTVYIYYSEMYLMKVFSLKLHTMVTITLHATAQLEFLNFCSAYVYIKVCTFHQFIVVIVACTVWFYRDSFVFFWYWRYWCHIYCCSITYSLKFSQWRAQ